MFNVTWHINDKGRQNNNERGEQGGGGQMGF